jgi:hypothetical protein
LAFQSKGGEIKRMAFIDVLRFTAASALVGAALCGCQGDDNALPLPPDAGSADGHSDATASHDGAAEASTDAGSAADGPGDAGAQSDSGDGAPTSEAGDDTGEVDGVALSDAGDAAAD